MTGSGWGVLAGRVTAIMIAVWAATSLETSLSFGVMNGRSLFGSPIPFINSVLMIALAFVVWKFAYRFLPEPPSEGEVEPAEFGVVAVATLMAFASMHFVRNALEHIVQATNEESYFKPPTVVVVLEIGLCVLSVVALINARSVSKWLLR